MPVQQLFLSKNSHDSSAKSPPRHLFLYACILLLEPSYSVVGEKSLHYSTKINQRSRRSSPPEDILVYRVQEPGHEVCTIHLTLFLMLQHVRLSELGESDLFFNDALHDHIYQGVKSIPQRKYSFSFIINCPRSLVVGELSESFTRGLPQVTSQDLRLQNLMSSSSTHVRARSDMAESSSEDVCPSLSFLRTYKLD